MRNKFFYVLLQCLLALPFSYSIIYGDSHDQAALEDPANEQTYLRMIFSDGSQEFFRNWECPEGAWAEGAWAGLGASPICVCVKGVYAIGSNLCEDNFKIITGNEHCFDVKDQTIRKMIPLIGKSGFAGRANTVFRSDGPYFARLMSSVPTTSVAEAMNYVFRMNDPNDFSIYAKLDDGQAARLGCLGGQQVSETPAETPIMQIGKLPNCSNEFRGPKDWCSELSADYETSLQIGDSWSPSGESKKGEAYPGSCAKASAVQGRSTKLKPATSKASKSKPKPSKPKSKSRGKRWAGKKAAKKKPGQVKGRSSDIKSVGGPQPLDQPKCDKFEKTLMEPMEFDTPANHFIQYEMLESDLVPKFHSASLHQKEINKQNKRVGHQLRKFFLNGTAPPNFLTPFQEYKYIQSAKELTKKICPEKYVPPHVLNVLTGAFRLLYLDSTKTFPYPLPFNEAEHTRIMDALTKCTEGALPVSIFTSNVKGNGNDTNATSSSSSSSSCGTIMVNATLNETTFSVLDPATNLSMPGHASFNFSAVDVALELVWKMTLLTHYYCTPKFEENPLDLTQFYVKVEAMFLNPMMQFRWYYPGQFNRLMQFFLMSYDLIQVAKGLDLCVAAVYSNSNFPGWMSRPADLLGYDGGRSKYLSHEVGRSVSPKFENMERSQRKKRFYLQDDMWKRQAYCMHTTDAPFVEVRTSTFPSCKKKPAWFENIE